MSVLSRFTKELQVGLRTLRHLVGRRALNVCSTLGLVLAATSAAAADETLSPGGSAPTEAAPAPAPSAEDAAKERTRVAIDLAKQKQWGAALAEAQEARRLFATWQSTILIARSLNELARFDESLDAYALLLRDHEVELKKDKAGAVRYAAVLQEIEKLRKLVGKIEINGAEPGAMIVVDLKWRGNYPLLEPLRVASGSHVVRVYKEGYEPFETRIEVAGGNTEQVVAPLVKLKVTGTLQVFEETGKTLNVVVDGLDLGETGREGWQGILAPGDHTVLLQGEGDIGTLPVPVNVKPNAVTPLRLSAQALRSSFKIYTAPANATVAFDRVNVGRGLWAGKVSVGKHRVEIAAEGFVLQVKELEFQEGKPEKLDVTLERDPLSPLWKDNRGRFFVEAAAGPGLVPSFGGAIAAATSAPGIALMATARGGYRFPSGFVLGIDAGYGALWQSVADRTTSLRPVGIPDLESGTVTDTLSLRGVLLGASGGVRIGKDRPLTVRLGAGAMIGTFRDHRAGTFTTRPRSAAPEAVSYDVILTQRQPVVSVYVAPEVRMGFPLRERLELSVGLRGIVLVTPNTPKWKPDETLANASTSGFASFADDELLGQVVVAVEPDVGIRYEF